MNLLLNDPFNPVGVMPVPVPVPIAPSFVYVEPAIAVVKRKPIYITTEYKVITSDVATTIQTPFGPQLYDPNDYMVGCYFYC